MSNIPAGYPALGKKKQIRPNRSPSEPKNNGWRNAKITQSVSLTGYISNSGAESIYRSWQVLTLESGWLRRAQTAQYLSKWWLYGLDTMTMTVSLFLGGRGTPPTLSFLSGGKSPPEWFTMGLWKNPPPEHLGGLGRMFFFNRQILL